MENETKKTVSHEEIAAVVEKTADKATTRRVLSAALANPAVRGKWELLRRLDGETVPATVDLSAQAARLEAALRQTTRDIAHEHTDKAVPQTLSGASRVRETVENFADTVTQAAQEMGERILLVGRHLLTLPILAPATASPALDAAPPRRQIVTTGEGVRIEFHELPGAGGENAHRLRILVDASPLHSQTSNTEWRYNVAYVVLEDNTPSAPEHHTLVVALNERGVGFTDFHVGAKAGGLFLPVPQGECRLSGVTLSRLTSAPQ